jgi:hypothetical protein
MAKKRSRRKPRTARVSRTVPRHEQRMCAAGAWLFDVEHAFRLLRAKPRMPQLIEVVSWSGIHGPDGSSISPIRPGPSFDPFYAMTVDLTRPLIMATIPTPDGGSATCVIDGTHRLFRALVEGVVTLPAYVLSIAETARITRARPAAGDRAVPEVQSSPPIWRVHL